MSKITKSAEFRTERYDSFTGATSLVNYVPSIHKLFHVYRGIRLVRAIPCQKILHATIQSLCMDSCCSAHRRGAILPHHSEYL